MKCKCKKICRKSESILLFSYENIVPDAGQSMCAAMNVFLQRKLTNFTMSFSEICL